MVIASICLFLGIAFGWCLARVRTASHEDDPRNVFLREQGVRLSLAQHWARAGAMSQAHETWRPAMTGLSVATLLLPDVEELAAMLEVMRDGSPPELANVWTQAAGELRQACRQRRRDLLAMGEVEREHEIRVMTGKRLDGSPDWDQSVLWDRAAEILASAQKGAENLLHRRPVRQVDGSGPRVEFS